jgi:hypothetical protein
VSIVAFPGPDTGATDGIPTAVAVERFLDSITVATTRAGYAETLARLTAVTGPAHLVAALTPEHYAAVMDLLHQLCHSALQHLAQAGRTAPQIPEFVRTEERSRWTPGFSCSMSDVRFGFTGTGGGWRSGGRKRPGVLANFPWPGA